MRSHSLTFGAAILFILFGAAAGAAARPADAPESISPFKISRAVNESKRLWDRKRVVSEVDLGPTWERLGVEPSNFGLCAGDCEARIFRHELDGRPGAEVLLKLTKSFEFCRYLIFMRSPASRAGKVDWQFLGVVDHDFNRYQMSRHSVAAARGRNWLVVRGQEGSGTGFSLYVETWYEVSTDGVRPVLRYPAEGHVAPWPAGVGRAFKAKIIGPRRTARAVTLLYSVSYEKLDYSEDDYEKLYRNRHYARYVWDDVRRAFVFDAARSSISESEIAATADLEVEPGTGEQIGGSTFFSDGEAWKRGGYEVFLKYNLRGLLRIARSKDAGRKEWLRQFLKDCADTPEKKVLEGALREQR